MKRTVLFVLTACALLPLSPSRVHSDAGAVDGRGFIHGTVDTRSGNTYTGVLRWGNEEAFWDDHFNSAKKDLPYMKLRPREEERRGIEIFGITIGYRWDRGEPGRQFVARFGDIAEIRPRGGDRAEVVMKSGATIAIDGGSNDLGGTIVVLDETLGEVEVSWRRVERIAFSATPATIRPKAHRLYGKLRTEDGEFEGWIQWDSQECLSTDRLDGEGEDGDLSIEMGRIRAIERAGRRAAKVEMKDGRQLVLRGTNDVNDTIRGIMVEDERYGRVKVSWDVFDRLDFIDTTKSGRGYDEFPAGRPLRGTVTDRSGAIHAGALIYDLDEAETWEILHADRHGAEYHIPFERVRSIEPDGRKGKVTLRSGIELSFEEGFDVSERNAGIAILGAGADGADRYLPWAEVKRIDFE